MVDLDRANAGKVAATGTVEHDRAKHSAPKHSAAKPGSERARAGIPVRKVAAEPISDDELGGLIGTALCGFDTVIVAVSGGADSVALLYLIDRWRTAEKRPGVPRLVVATVDHGLRPEAADEAVWVGRLSVSMGLDHHVLSWTGDKPSTGLQAAARAARYRLLSALAESIGGQCCAVALAHTLDDQAETLLMRLGRGSGLDGLAAMAGRRAFGGERGATLVRPLIGVPKSRLVATLLQAGVGWLEDPSNEMEQFERVRLRRAKAVLEQSGLVNERLALSARRLGRALEALRAATRALEIAAVDYHDGAYALIDGRAFDAAAEDLQLRLIQRVIQICGDRSSVPGMARMETLVGRMARRGADGRVVAATLAGCQFKRDGDAIIAVREPGRKGLAEIQLTAGQGAIWDERFVVRVSVHCTGVVRVKALGADGWRAIRAEHAGDMPRSAGLTLPSFWVEGKLAGVPHLRYIGGPETKQLRQELDGPVSPFEARLIAPA